MIITFASSKGGVGKSTTCAAIASALALNGERVLLIDLDQNRTLDRWAKKAPIEGLTVSAIDPQKFGSFFREKEASGQFDHICIDLPGNREVTLFKALARRSWRIHAAPRPPHQRRPVRPRAGSGRPW